MPNHTPIKYRRPTKNSDRVTPTSLNSNSPPAHHLSSFKHFSIGTSSDWHRLIFSHTFHTIDATVPKAYIVFPKSLTYITDFQLFLHFSALLERTHFAAVSTDNVQKNLRQQGNGDTDYVQSNLDNVTLVNRTP